MTTIRLPAVAGLFYPADEDELRAAVRHYLEGVADSAGESVPKALIAPHAGYIYSAPIAASAYARIRSGRNSIKHVVLMGPSHRVPFQGLALSSASAFATPLGQVTVDRQAQAAVADLSQMTVLDRAHSHEHSLEVHLPFLQELLDDFAIVPIAAGDASPEDVAEVLNRLWGADDTLIVVSSDLSHYHDYETAARLDRATSRAIEKLRPEDIAYEQACGRVPITGLLMAARQHGLRARTVDLRNSGDTAGPRDQVVGYGAYVFD